MDATVQVAIIAGVVGLITGAIGSLVAPWANWLVEKKKQKLAYRRQLISDARTAISSIILQSVYDGKSGGPKSTDATEVIIKLSMQKDILYFFPSITMELDTDGKGVSDLTFRLLDELSKKEKEWDLI